MAYKYINTFKLIKKNTNEYQNTLKKIQYSPCYQSPLKSLLNKESVRIESTDFVIQSKTLDIQKQKIEYNLITLRNAHITRVIPYSQERLPIILDKLDVIVGADCIPDSNYNKIKIIGKCSEYINNCEYPFDSNKSFHTCDVYELYHKSVEVDIQSCEFNNGKNIVIPKNYQEGYVFCPDEFREMILDEKECEFLGFMKLYNWKDISEIPDNIVKMFDGPFITKKIYDKLSKIPNLDMIYSYILKTGSKKFLPNSLPVSDKRVIFGHLKTKPKCYTYSFETAFENREKRLYRYNLIQEEKELSYIVLVNDLIELIKYGNEYNNENDEELDINIPNNNEDRHNRALSYMNCMNMDIYEKLGLITIGTETFNRDNIYSQELEEYKELAQKLDEDIQALKNRYGETNFNPPEIKKPVKHSSVYHYAIPTEKGKNLIRWFGYEIPKHISPSDETIELY